MTDAEASFFRALLCARDQWSRAVTNGEGLKRVMSERPNRTRLISFCSDLIIPGRAIEDLNFECFNFHSGPPERPGYRPTAFAIAQKTSDYGVTFHRMTAQVDAGPIYATRRFPLPSHPTQESVDVLVYQYLILLAKDLSSRLADYDAVFEPNGEVWSGAPTTRAEYERLSQLQRIASR